MIFLFWDCRLGLLESLDCMFENVLILAFWIVNMYYFRHAWSMEVFGFRFVVCCMYWILSCWTLVVLFMLSSACVFVCWCVLLYCFFDLLACMFFCNAWCLSSWSKCYSMSWIVDSLNYWISFVVVRLFGCFCFWYLGHSGGFQWLAFSYRSTRVSIHASVNVPSPLDPPPALIKMRTIHIPDV